MKNCLSMLKNKNELVIFFFVFFQCAYGFYRCFFLTIDCILFLFRFQFRFRHIFLFTLLYFMNTFGVLLLLLLLLLSLLCRFFCALIRVTVFICNTYNCMFSKKKKKKTKRNDEEEEMEKI